MVKIGKNPNKFDFKESINFSWSAKPYLLMQINNGELPFGLHAYNTIYKYLYLFIPIYTIIYYIYYLVNR